jgi:hypothetical protein
MPPVPPASRSPKAPGGRKDKTDPGKEGRDAPPGNLKEQGQQGNTFQNTHHQGYQQDR